MRASFCVALLVLLSTTLFTACGGGGGGGSNAYVNDGIGNTMTVVTSSSTPSVGWTGTFTYTEGPINGYGYYDPDMEADIAPTTGRTWITLSSGVTGSGMPDTVINLWTSGHVPGPYAITGDCTHSSPTCVSYSRTGQHYDSVVSSGTVTIDGIGNVGEPVAGSFSAVLSLSTSSTTTLGMSGTFNMKRAH